METRSATKRIATASAHSAFLCVELALPFLCVGDLPTVAAVCKVASRVPKESLQQRLAARPPTFVADHQELVVYETEGDTPACYQLQSQGTRDFRSLPSGVSACVGMQKEGEWCIYILELPEAL